MYCLCHIFRLHYSHSPHAGAPILNTLQRGSLENITREYCGLRWTDCTIQLWCSRLVLKSGENYERSKSCQASLRGYQHFLRVEASALTAEAEALDTHTASTVHTPTDTMIPSSTSTHCLDDLGEVLRKPLKVVQVLLAKVVVSHLS